MSQTPKQTTVQPKKRFHHGDLREALIATTRELLIEHGPDGFTLADACRRAGVTTAAPYKHFRGKEEVLQEVISRGFDELTAANAKAVAEGRPGTLAGITAMVISYLNFAAAQPAIFRLMFGHRSDLRKVEEVVESGNRCLKTVISEVADFSRKPGQKFDADRVAIQLWTFVHGASSLKLGGHYERVAPGLDVRDLIADITPRPLCVFPKR